VDIKKVIAKLPSGFVDDAAAMSPDELRQCIVDATANMERIQSEQEADEKLTGAKELVRDYSAGYKEARAAQAAKVSYCHHRLAELGTPAGD
jgi:hypothetical protein